MPMLKQHKRTLIDFAGKINSLANLLLKSYSSILIYLRQIVNNICYTTFMLYLYMYVFSILAVSAQVLV